MNPAVGFGGSSAYEKKNTALFFSLAGNAIPALS